MTQPTYTRKQFAAKIKEKYPAYAEMDDDALIDKITAKYPQYLNQIEGGKTQAVAGEIATVAADQQSGLDLQSENGLSDSSSTDSQPEVLQKDLTFPEPQKEIPTEVAPEIPEVLIETQVDISPKEIEDQRKFLEEQGIDVDAALRRRKFGDVPSIGTEEEDVSSIYSTYLTDKSSRNIITDLSSGLSKPAQRELDDEVELKPTEIDENILKSLKINEEDYSKWEQNTQREESASFKFIKEAIATDEGEEFADEKKNIERLASYKNEIIGNLQEDIKTINSKLQLALDPKDKLELLNIKKQLEGRLTEESTLLSGIADLFPKFTELTSKLDLDRRKRVYVAGQIGGNIQLFTEAGEIAKTIPTTTVSYTHLTLPTTPYV